MRSFEILIEIFQVKHKRKILYKQIEIFLKLIKWKKKVNPKNVKLEHKSIGPLFFIIIYLLSQCHNKNLYQT